MEFLFVIEVVIKQSTTKVVDCFYLEVYYILIENKINIIKEKLAQYNKNIEIIADKWSIKNALKEILGYFLIIIPFGFIEIMTYMLINADFLSRTLKSEPANNKIDILICYALDHFFSPFVFIFPALILLLPKIASIITYSITFFTFYIYSVAQYCSYLGTGNLFRLGFATNAAEGIEFADDVLSKIGYLKITLLVFVFILSIINVITYTFIKPKLKNKEKVLFAIIFILICVISAYFIATFKNTVAKSVNYDKSNYKYYTYDTLSDINQAYKSSGIYHVFFRDIYLTLKSNITDDSQEQINEITAYLNQRSNHDANSMTGIFKGKNLIVVQMESMDYRVVNNQVCPNISKLRKESIDFSNFYTSRMGGATTFGTEFCINTGLYQPSGTNAATYFSENHFPYSLANLFKRLGYNAESFHYNDEYFYNRGKNHITLGFEKYNSFMNYTNDETAITFDDYLLKNQKLWSDFINNNELPFFSYLITYSAHVPYGLNDKIYLEALKRHPELNDESIDENLNIFRLKASITDDMVGNLVDKLDQENQLDNTVIIFITDHQAYGCNNTKLAQTDSRINNTPFFIYAKGFQSKKVEKVCNTSDVLPTICNLFDLDTDYKYLGHDIFDEEYDGYAYFPDLSWISNKAYYSKGNIIDQYTDNITNEEIKEMNDKIIEIIDINNKILFTDYYNN